MHRIDFTASEKKVHHAIENEGREQGKPDRLPSVIRNVLAGRDRERKIQLEADQRRNNCIDSSGHESQNQDCR